jgi:hypothetical protein
MITMDPNILLLYVNTIQLLSLIQHLNIDLPFEIRKQQSSTDKYIKKINLLSYIKIHDRDLKDNLVSFSNDDNSFLGNSVYYLVMTGTILIINILFYFITRFGKGKFKEIANKAIQHLNYTIYIQLYIISLNASCKLVHVKYI